jgi:hypothetical protein
MVEWLSDAAGLKQMGMGIYVLPVHSGMMRACGRRGSKRIHRAPGIDGITWQRIKLGSNPECDFWKGLQLCGCWFRYRA